LRPNYEQNDIPRENRLIFDEVMTDQSFWKNVKYVFTKQSCWNFGHS